MITNKIANLLLTTIFFFTSPSFTTACSMYKVTLGEKTMVGCNEDAWRTTSRIWFENPKNKGEYGACFTGSRNVGGNKFAPQSGMNEFGLVFSRLTSYHPQKEVNHLGKKQINDEVEYFTSILHQCKTVKEVKAFIEQYDYSFFKDDVFIYVDKSGDYLVVEPYQLIEGNDSSYVLGNFCPSITTNQQARKQRKFKCGEDYVKKNGIDTTFKFCTALSDTMHVCRNRNGDGTLLTSIWDTQQGLVNLYFYHNYKSTVQFDLSEELAKGDHLLSIPELFPENLEFKRLAEYKTPFNMPILRVGLVFVAGFLLLLSFLWMISYFKHRNRKRYNRIKLALSGLNVLLIPFLAVLATTKNIFYFDAPYQHYHSDWLSLSSYIPILLLLVIVPMSVYNFRYLKWNQERIWMKGILFSNNLLYLLLVIGFGYWGFFEIIN